MVNQNEKILQFGEGNFLRAFFDYFVDVLNRQNLFQGKIVVVQPIQQGFAQKLNENDCKYTVLLRGIEDGQLVTQAQRVESISRAIDPHVNFVEYMETMKNPALRFIVSNTTEAGIAFAEGDRLGDQPPSSFPAKVTALLYHRFKYFGGDLARGFIFLPCELIDNNGAKLKELVLRYAAAWGLPQEFAAWVQGANHFANTLVDRIVTGFPKDEAAQLGYNDDLLVAGEVFHFFAIEAEAAVLAEIGETLPFANVGLNVVLTEDVSGYKRRKVRILNGAHTMTALAARLAGLETVGQIVQSPAFSEFLRGGIHEEIILSMGGPAKELEVYAATVLERFANPHITHYLEAIAMNSVAKFRARVLPSILEYYKREGRLPARLTLSFAALLAYYKLRQPNDEPAVLEFFAKSDRDVSAFVKSACANESFWGQNLCEIPGFVQAVTKYVSDYISGEVKLP
ncbi:MAG: tagaturonate reductase [Defluviitaleaceae bacterium]|nr:tagaturonate reductase [Defluviitaleaceae bacterium]